MAVSFVIASLVTVGLFGAFAPEPRRAQRAGEVIERTLAIVGGQVITLSDVQTALALGLIERVPQADGLGRAISLLIDRTLVLREVERYRPPEPSDGEVEGRLAAIRSGFQSPAELDRTLAAGGFSEARLRDWVRDDLRIASYLSQRFATVGTPTNDEVSRYYAGHRAEFDRQQLTFEAAASIIRERLSAERRAELIDDWVADLRRRTTIVELWKPPQS